MQKSMIRQTSAKCGCRQRLSLPPDPSLPTSWWSNGQAIRLSGQTSMCSDQRRQRGSKRVLLCHASHSIVASHILHRPFDSGMQWGYFHRKLCIPQVSDDPPGDATHDN